MDASDWTFLGMYIATWLTFLFYIFLTLRCCRLESKRQRLQDEVKQLEDVKAPYGLPPLANSVQHLIEIRTMLEALLLHHQKGYSLSFFKPINGKPINGSTEPS